MGTQYATEELNICTGCELVHICPPSIGHKMQVGEDQAMRRIPEWLTIDILIIAVAMVFIGAVVMIVP